MSTLSSLIAKLGDCPKCEAYQRHAAAWEEEMKPLGEVNVPVSKSLADAALLELAKRLAVLTESHKLFQKRAEAAEAELVVSKRLNGKWMDERTEAIIRAEAAEARVAELERIATLAESKQLEAERAKLRAEAERVALCEETVRLNEQWCAAQKHIETQLESRWADYLRQRADVLP